jgi:hypothetical protein
MHFGSVITCGGVGWYIQAAGFGGTNIDPTAWEDKKCAGESRFPAQVTSSIRPLKLMYGATVVGIATPYNSCTIPLYRVGVYVLLRLFDLLIYGS